MKLAPFLAHSKYVGDTDVSTALCLAVSQAHFYFYTVTTLRLHSHVFRTLTGSHTSSSCLTGAGTKGLGDSWEWEG